MQFEKIVVPVKCTEFFTLLLDYCLREKMVMETITVLENGCSNLFYVLRQLIKYIFGKKYLILIRMLFVVITFTVKVNRNHQSSQN